MKKFILFLFTLSKFILVSASAPRLNLNSYKFVYYNILILKYTFVYYSIFNYIRQYVLFIDLLFKEQTITKFHRRADYQIVDLLNLKLTKLTNALTIDFLLKKLK